METQNKLIRVFSGSEITVSLLGSELEKIGIATEIINENEQANFRGGSAGTPYSVDLYILDTDLEKADPIVKDFMKINDI